MKPYILINNEIMNDGIFSLPSEFRYLITIAFGMDKNYKTSFHSMEEAKNCWKLCKLGWLEFDSEDSDNGRFAYRATDKFKKYITIE